MRKNLMNKKFGKKIPKINKFSEKIISKNSFYKLYPKF